MRAELGRQGLTQRQLAERMHVGAVWLSRRIGRKPDVDLTLEEIERMAEALGVTSERLLLGWLPRLDSNQQPSGYRSQQVTGGRVVEMQRFRRDRGNPGHTRTG